MLGVGRSHSVLLVGVSVYTVRAWWCLVAFACFVAPNGISESPSAAPLNNPLCLTISATLCQFQVIIGLIITATL